MAARTDELGRDFDKLDMNDLFEKKEKKAKIRLEYAAYDIFIIVRNFIFGEPSTKHSEETFSSVAEALVVQGDSTDANVIEASRKLLEQQRLIENTRARRRLERWVTRLITWYLIIVLILIVSNSLVAWLSDRGEGFISSGIMAAILTTTTVNIIGLGLIVLRGHFLTKEDTEGK